MRTAKSFIEVTSLGRPTPQFGGAVVVSEKKPVLIANINRKRHLLEQPRWHFESLIIRLQYESGMG